MNNIAQQAITLKLNKNWETVGISVVQKAIVDLVSGVVKALDIQYQMNSDGTLNTEEYEYVNPVDWETWLTLPVRPWDPVIHSSRLSIRAPTVVITSNYDKMPTKKYRGKPRKEALFYRDKGLDIHTGLPLEWDDASIDHIVPISRGGTDTYDNTGLTTKKINNEKGNRLDSEAGLTCVFKPVQPKEVPIWATIRKMRHPDWKFFMRKIKDK